MLYVHKRMENDKKHIIPYGLLAKYFNGYASEKEIHILEKWTRGTKKNRQAFDELKNLWESLYLINDTYSIDLNNEWQNQLNAIGFEEKTKTETRNYFSYWNFSKIAAVVTVLIISLVAFYFYGPQFQLTRTTDAGEIESVTLSDGTVVTLNENTSFTYPARFKEDIRKVKLSGEAFFEVMPDPEKPFKISAEGTIIQVLGTSFNLNAYQNMNRVEITMQQGKAAFFEENLPSNRIELSTGQMGIYDKTDNKLNLKQIEDVNFLAWKTKRIIFRKDSLPYVVNVLEKVYNTSIQLANPDLNNCLITVTFEKQSLKSIFSVIESTLNVKIEEKDGKYIIVGNGC